jgi:hypothetical protein
MRPIDDIAVHLVCAEMQQSRLSAIFGSVGFDQLQQVMDTIDVGVNEIIAVGD